LTVSEKLYGRSGGRVSNAPRYVKREGWLTRCGRALARARSSLRSETKKSEPPIVFLSGSEKLGDALAGRRQ